jgi:hypothetical protein
MVPGWGWGNWMECDLHLPCVLTPPKGSRSLESAACSQSPCSWAAPWQDLSLPGAASLLPHPHLRLQGTEAFWPRGDMDAGFREVAAKMRLGGMPFIAQTPHSSDQSTPLLASICSPKLLSLPSPPSSISMPPHLYRK